MGDTLTVTPHPEGDWLISAGDSCFAVPKRLGRALLPLQNRPLEGAVIQDYLAQIDPAPSGATSQKEELSKDEVAALATLVGFLLPEISGEGKALKSFLLPRVPKLRPLWLRLPLVPRSITARIAHYLQLLTSWPALLGLVLMGAMGYLTPWLIFHLLPGREITVARLSENISGRVLGLALILFLFTALWHEFGHASALARQGYRPGGIGAGLLFVIPVLFADVTPMGALKPKARVRVDVAGLCFQIGLGGMMFGTGYLIGITWADIGTLPCILATALRSAGTLASVAVIWSLIPFIRSDGYWLICDLMDVPDLERPLTGSPSWRLTLFLIAYRLANVAFLWMVAKMISSRVLKWWGILFAWLDGRIENALIFQAGKILLIGLMALIGLGVLRRVKGLLWSSWLDFSRRV